MSDRLNTDETVMIRDAADDSFSTLARTHDRLISEAVELYDRNNRNKNASLVAQAGHKSRLAAVVKAIMQVRFPEASDDWFA